MKLHWQNMCSTKKTQTKVDQINNIIKTDNVK